MPSDRMEINEDPGFFELSLEGRLVKLDLYETNNWLITKSRECGENLNEYHAAIATWLQNQLGLAQRPSFAVAVTFMDRIFDRVEAVRKKLGGLPE